MAGRARPAAAAGTLDALPPEALAAIAQQLAADENPLTWDRMDMLQTAARLMLAGSKGSRALAELLFRQLSPHLGEPPPAAAMPFVCGQPKAL